MESDSQVQTTSVLDKQSSGTNFDGKNENNGVNGSSETSVSSGFNSNNGSYVSSDEKPSEGAKNDAPVSENASGGESEASVVGVESPKPVAKVTEDDDENEVFSGEEGGGGVGGGRDGGDVAVEEAPRVRVSAEESEDEVFEEAKEEPGDEEKREGETGEAKEGVGGGEGVGVKTEGTDGLGSSNGEGEGEGVDSVEEDAVVDSINVDAGEVVRSGVAVVGVDEEKQDSQEVVETGDKAEKVEESSVIDEHSLEDSASADGAGVKSTDEGHAVVESKQTDGGETNNSGATGVGDVKEDSVSKVEVVPAEVNSSDEVKATVEDSVVDGVNVDVVKAVTSGVAVFGDSGGSEPEKEVKEEAGPVGENVTVANEFEPLAREASSEADDGDGKHNEEALVDAEEINSIVDESKQQESGDGVQTSSNEKGEDASEIFDVPPEEFDDGGSDGDGEFFKGEASSRDFAEEFASGDRSEMIDGQVVTDSEEEGDSDDEGDGRELIDSAALAALLKAATSAGASESGNITITSQDGSRLFSVERPAGLGTSLRSVRPPTNSSNSSIFAPPSAAAPTEESLSEEDKKKLQKIQDLRVKFLRLVQRLGQTADQSVAAQVLYKLAILSGRATFPSFSLDNAKQTAAQLEAEGNDDLDFSLNILVLGKTGVGKSATINSIFGEEKVKINAFEPETTSVNLVSGILDGVKLRVIDAPGLKTSASEQGFNRKVLAMVKKYTQKFPPDLMLYVDRLDSQTRDLNDLPILRTITSSLGNSIWRSAILTLTHAACAPPDGPSGAPLGYEVFVGQRSHIIQQSIGQAVGDLRFMNLSMMSPVSLVENHPACRKNREGQKVLPNGQAWRPQLLLLCYSLKILADASLTSKPQDPVDHRKLFGFRVRSPPLPYLLSSLLQPRTHPKLSADQGGDNGDSDIDLDDLSDTDQEEEDEYDQLPPFKPLRKTQIAKLSGEQRKAYFDEYDYRVKLLQKKQWREELKRMREMKKNGKSSLDDSSEMPEDYDGENGAPAAVPVPLPDMVLPPSFDSDSPAYRYRFLEPTSQFLARPVLDTHGWDHDCGYDGVNVEQNLGIAGRYPAAVTVQVTKDKKDFNIHLDSAVSAKHGDNGSSLVGFDIQTIGKQLAYIVRGESKFKTMKKNKTAGGVSVTFLGENVATGLKLEDQISLGKRLVLVGTAGTVLSQKDAAYGSNLEVRLKDADYPIGQDQSSFVLSLMKWRGDLAIGGNLQSQLSVGRSSKMAVRLALNNKQSGQITVKLNSSDHLALASVGVIPIFLAIYRKFKSSPSENYTLY